MTDLNPFSKGDSKVIANVTWWETTLAQEERTKTLKELARENTESALAALLNVAQATSDSAARRMQAANALLERAWGRPLQH